MLQFLTSLTTDKKPLLSPDHKPDLEVNESAQRRFKDFSDAAAGPFSNTFPAKASCNPLWPSPPALSLLPAEPAASACHYPGQDFIKDC
jgi:hypothetical protein